MALSVLTKEMINVCSDGCPGHPDLIITLSAHIWGSTLYPIGITGMHNSFCLNKNKETASTP